MADPRIALKLTGSNEGGYSNNPKDRGKRTYNGISQVFHPAWKGWTLIMAWIAKHGEPKTGYKFTEIPGLEVMSEDFYIDEYWNIHRLSELKNQALANNIYDQEVNGGAGPAIKMEQKNAGVPETGHMDDETIEAINNPKSNIPNV